MAVVDLYYEIGEVGFGGVGQFVGDFQAQAVVFGVGYYLRVRLQNAAECSFPGAFADGAVEVTTLRVGVQYLPLEAAGAAAGGGEVYVAGGTLRGVGGDYRLDGRFGGIIIVVAGAGRVGDGRLDALAGQIGDVRV